MNIVFFLHLYAMSFFHFFFFFFTNSEKPNEAEVKEMVQLSLTKGGNFFFFFGYYQQ